ncbi:hypothetical protein M0638_24460 [Roseomonas sp. NAR14]|uniref:Lipoprotein n=1 Tax=Roseomonas acroporae TaxID=2937791 RepID=A0A9X2BW91_9PROT|nr:hypothetical protein [Roseomonas acroporae]MCK8787528.1 hypothetical protein [Roseomonas acroporae]
MKHASAILLAGFVAMAALPACAPQTVYVTAPQQVCDSRFQIANESSRTVERFYFSSSADGQWGVDQLGTAVLPPSARMNFRAANAGNYDFRVIWVGGREAQIRAVNICVASRIAVTDSGLYAR